MTIGSTLFILLPAAALFLSACPATHQARSVERSGFLGNYASLEEGEDDEALLVYVDREAAWGNYDSIQIDPIVIWKNENTEIDAEDAKALLDYLDATLRKHLRDDYRIVDRPDAGVLRLRVAITETDASWPFLDTISTIAPQPRALAALKRIATGSASFVGKSSIEAEILDSVTNRRLAAAVDRRVGQKRLKGSFDEWDDVQGAFDFWAERLKTRLGELRGGKATSRAHEGRGEVS